MDFKKKSRPFFIIIFKLKNGNFKTRDFSPIIERVLAGVGEPEESLDESLWRTLREPEESLGENIWRTWREPGEKLGRAWRRI